MILLVKKNVIKAARGRFASAMSLEKEQQIRSLINDRKLTLPEVAQKTGVSLESILRRKGLRASVREAQAQYYQILKKDYVLPLVRELALSAKTVTVARVLRELSIKYKGEFSKTLVSRAIEEIAKEGMRFERSREYYEAKAVAEKKRAQWKKVDDLIILLRLRFPDWRDEQIVAEINEHLDRQQKIGYNTLRKRITFLKKEGKLSKVRRGYKA